MDAGQRGERARLERLCARHGVSVDRCEGIPLEWHPLVDEALARLVGSGWTHRRVAQLKEKFGSLRIHVDREGESEAFLSWATWIAIEFRERSRVLAHPSWMVPHGRTE